MQITDNFRQAIDDYAFLLEKKYPEKTIHEMVSTRYALNHFERSVLYRGITTKVKAGLRKSKLITINQLNNRTLHIDLFNVLFTIAAYLRGFPVYISMDGLLRDASEGHDSHEWVSHLEKALDLLLRHVDGLKIAKAVFYLDNPLHLSCYIAKEIEKRAGTLKHEMEVILHDSPDHLIEQATEGVVCTSDSMIIDRISLPVFDLSNHVLSKSFKIGVISLETL